MASPTAPKLYVDRMSQPARTCLIFCKAAGIPVEEVRLSIAKQEHRRPDFLAVNPLGKIPALQDGDFVLPESAAIVSYLCATRHLADHWHPRDPRARARVDSALHWHGSTLRIGSMVTVWNNAISLSLGFKGNGALVADYGLPKLKQALQMCPKRRTPLPPPPRRACRDLEGVWLRDGPYVAGQRQISVADLLLACEVEQLCLLDGAAQGPTMAELLAPHPGVRAWLRRVSQECAPHYDEVHALLRKSRDRLMARKQQGSRL